MKDCLVCDSSHIHSHPNLIYIDYRLQWPFIWKQKFSFLFTLLGTYLAYYLENIVCVRLVVECFCR